MMYELSQDIGRRLSKYGLTVQGVQITIRDKELDFEQFQVPLRFPTQSPLEIAQAAYTLFLFRYRWHKSVRALTVRGIKTESENQPVQLDVFNDYQAREKRRSLDRAVDEIRRRFGYNAVCPASLMGDLHMAQDRCETVPMPAPMYR